MIGGGAIDMSRYVNGNPLTPGEYSVDIHVNGVFQQSSDITFVPSEDPNIASPCLPSALIGGLPLKPALLRALEEQGTACVDLPSLIEGATVGFDSGTLQLSLGIPQAALAGITRGHVPPEQREDGITAGFMDYSFNHHRGRGSDNTYLGLRGGLNLGAWRLRHRASINHDGEATRHNVISSHVQRDIAAWNSQLLLGQGSTGGELFESVAFSGVRVASDERMLPDALRGYAPVVQGIAEGNAVVTVRQNGNVIHESSVAAGPFSIEDLYPTNFGGDLDVTVTGTDGRVQRFSVNFSAVPQALRAGASRFAITVGTLRGGIDELHEPAFTEATYAHGVNNYLTMIGGMQLADGYRATLAGAALNTALGAFGADVTQSHTDLRHHEDVAGNSIRLNYQRYIAWTGTNVGLAAYRYSTRGFFTLADAARAQAGIRDDLQRARQRYQVNFSQKLGRRSHLYLSGGHVAYWNSAHRQTDFQFGFQGVLGRANYGASVLRYRLGQDRQDTRYAFTLSLPLGRGTHTPRLSSQLGHATGGRQAQLGIHGTVSELRALSYSISASRAEEGHRSTSAYAAWEGSHGNANVGYSRADAYRSFNLGAAGSVAAHRGGLLVGPPVGEGFVLVHAPGAEGARVGSGIGIRVARNGYALVPDISPYRWNTIDLDPSGLPLDVELLQTSRRVAPTAGSIVRLPFDVRRERTLFIDATDIEGRPLPFAARVEDERGRTVGAVGQGGVVQLRGAQAAGALMVDPEGPHRCRLAYRLPDAPDAYGLFWSRSSCVPQPQLPAGLQAHESVTEAMPVPSSPTAD